MYITALLFALWLRGASSACMSPLDCSLNGVCAAGACNCNTGWTGLTCAVRAVAAFLPRGRQRS